MTKEQKKKTVKLKWYQRSWVIPVILIFLIVIGLSPIALIGALGVVFFQARSMNKNRVFYEKYACNEKKIKEREAYAESVEEKIANKEKMFEAEREVYLTEIQKEIHSENEEVIERAKKEALDHVENAQKEAEEILTTSQKDLQGILASIEKYNVENEELEKENQKLIRQTTTQANKVKGAKVEALGIKSLIETFPNSINLQALEEEVGKYTTYFDKETLLHNFIELDFHYKDSKELRKEMTSRKRELKKLLESYTNRYTTKANQTIYQLMVIGLQAELQNILYSLSAEKLDDAKENVKELVRKYLAICAEGNQNVLPTITRFLSEIEPLFLEMVEIEYRYYAKRELEKEEQRAIREQMRQDAAERKALKEQQKKIEREEEKFEIELIRNRELLENEEDATMVNTLQERIAELEQQQLALAEEKEEIVKRANGKAGYVYIISNLGSFGEDVYKVGMTRRMDPFDRIDELSSASVPFVFDVHAMIFSKDAVDLERKLHESLGHKRVNKINLRKEFFRTSVDELQLLAEETDPTVDFKRTLIAKEYVETLEMEKEQLLA